MFGYSIVFQSASHNLFLVRNDLIEGMDVPEIKYKYKQWHKRSDKKFIEL